MDAFLKYASYQGVESAAKAAGKSAIKSKTPAGKVQDMVDYLTPANIFGTHQIVGGLAVALQKAGVPVLSATNEILEQVKDKLKEKGGITEAELESIVYGKTGRPQKVSSSFYRALAFEKYAAPADKPSLIGKAIGLLFKPFGFLGGILFGVLKWLLKGAGLIGAGLLVHNYMTGKPPFSDEEPGVEPEEVFHERGDWPKGMEHTFKPISNWGLESHPNNKDTAWIVDFSGTLPQLLVTWTNRIYDLSPEQVRKIKNSAAFNKVVSVMRKGINPDNPKEVMVPIGAESIKEIVDMFVGEAE